MYSRLKPWICVWIILLHTFTYFAQTSHLPRKDIPYDVILPPDGNGEHLTPIVMLHGLFDWRKTWMKLAPEVAKNTGRKIYTYDATNHGENEWSDKFDITMLASELDQFIEDHNISKAILLGHSMGGNSAMVYTLRKPEKVEKLILEDISPRKPTSKVISFLKQFFLLVQICKTEFQHEDDELSARKIMARFMERLFTQEELDTLGRDFLTDWVPIEKRGEQFEWLSNIELFIKMGRTQTPEDWDPGVEGVFNGEVLFIYGTKSVFDVGTDELIPKHFPHASLVKFEGGIHLLHFQFSNEFERIVTEFINKKPSIK